MLKIAVIKEGKKPLDKRVPLIPSQAKYLTEHYPEVAVEIQASEIRCFENADYLSSGLPIVEDVSDADILLGVKEVPIDDLLEGKTYFFFSHTIKKQAYNRELLKAILNKKITLIDYECLTNSKNQRIVAFGRYAGIVGAYNGILTFGQRYNLFTLRRAHECFDLEDLKTEFEKVNLPPIKIVLTGGGRVAKGAQEVLDGMGIQQVSAADFLHNIYEFAVYTQLNPLDYNKPKKGDSSTEQEFFSSPQDFENDFIKYAHCADILIAGAFWDPAAPVLFARNEILDKNFKIKVIADITCDIEGSIPSTLQPCTIADPVYDYDPIEGMVDTPYSSESNITVMAVDNLPCELPRDASRDFGTELVENVLPHLINDDHDQIIERATIARNGTLTPRYAYLQDFVDGL